MVASYFRLKRIIVFSIAGVFLLLIAQKELTWFSSYVETPARIVSIDQSCAGGRVKKGYIDCFEALPQASRRTILLLSYTSPADNRPHQASIRCDTSFDNTPSWFVGEQLTILAHEDEPESIDRRKCRAVDQSERRA